MKEQLTGPASELVAGRTSVTVTSCPGLELMVIVAIMFFLFSSALLPREVDLLPKKELPVK